MIGVLVMMLSISPKMTLIALLILPVSLVLVLIVVKFSQKYFKAQQATLGVVNGQVEEVYSGHNVIKAFNREAAVLEKAAAENMEGQWETVIWQRLADACYLGGKSGDGEREQDWCQESFLYYERLLYSRQDGNRRKNLLRAAELALQFDMQEKAEQYLNEAAEILGMEEDIFYQQIRKRWEEAR